MKAISSGKKISRKTTSISILLVIIIIASSIMYLYTSRPNTNKSATVDVSNKKRSEEVKSKTQKKPSYKDGETSDSTGLSNDSTSKTTDEIPTSPSLSAIITSTSQTGGQVNATANVSTGGTCVFQYTTDGDKPVIDQVGAVNGSCRSSIPEVQFAKLGPWNLKLTFYNDGKKVETTTNVTIS